MAHCETFGLNLNGMTENDYVTELERRWPRPTDTDQALLATIALVDDAVRVFPQSPRLWCIRGDVIQLGPDGCPHNLEDARDCYHRAIDIDPQFVEAWESLGYFYHAVLDDEVGAARFFSEAERLKRSIPAEQNSPGNAAGQRA